MSAPGGPFPMPVERRAAALEVRASGRRLVGMAAKFGTEARIGRVRETIARGAFAGSLSGDILALMDHDPGKVLGRTRTGSLKLSEGSEGLAFELELPDTAAGNDALALATRGDLGGMSFGFVTPPGGDEWQGDLRTLRRVELKEISVVSAWPAYPDTEVALRAMSGLWEAERRRRALVIAGARTWR